MLNFDRAARFDNVHDVDHEEHHFRYGDTFDIVDRLNLWAGNRLLVNAVRFIQPAINCAIYLDACRMLSMMEGGLRR